MISKKRFWGLALAVWVFEDGSFFVVGSKEELKSLAVEGWDEFKNNSPEWFIFGWPDALENLMNKIN